MRSSYRAECALPACLTRDVVIGLYGYWLSIGDSVLDCRGVLGSGKGLDQNQHAAPDLASEVDHTILMGNAVLHAAKK